MPAESSSGSLQKHPFAPLVGTMPALAFLAQAALSMSRLLPVISAALPSCCGPSCRALPEAGPRGTTT